MVSAPESIRLWSVPGSLAGSDAQHPWTAAEFAGEDLVCLVFCSDETKKG